MIPGYLILQIIDDAIDMLASEEPRLGSTLSVSVDRYIADRMAGDVVIGFIRGLEDLGVDFDVDKRIASLTSVRQSFDGVLGEEARR